MAPAFSEANGQLSRPWRFAHHASTDSYRLELQGDVAGIERVGEEPWSMLVQPLSADQVQSLAGQRISFAMDIRANLDDSQFGTPIQPTGLIVQTWITPEAGSASPLRSMLGPRQGETARLALAPDARIPEWKRHELIFVLPEDLARMEIGVMMTTGGRLEVRNPSLHRLAD